MCDINIYWFWNLPQVCGSSFRPIMRFVLVGDELWLLSRSSSSSVVIYSYWICSLIDLTDASLDVEPKELSISGIMQFPLSAFLNNIIRCQILPQQSDVCWCIRRTVLCLEIKGMDANLMENGAVVHLNRHIMLLYLKLNLIATYLSSNIIPREQMSNV